MWRAMLASLVLAASEPSVYAESSKYRGLYDTAYNILSVPSLSINVRTANRVFVRWASKAESAPALINGVFAQALGKVVNGSFISAVYIRARSDTTGADVTIAILAEQTRTFRLYRSRPTSASHRSTDPRRATQQAEPPPALRQMPSVITSIIPTSTLATCQSQCRG